MKKMSRRQRLVLLVLGILLSVLVVSALSVVSYWKVQWKAEAQCFEQRLINAASANEEAEILNEMWAWMLRERRYYVLMMFQDGSASQHLFPPDLENGMKVPIARIVLKPAFRRFGPLHFDYEFEFVPKDPENLRILFLSLSPAEGFTNNIKDLI